MHPTVFSSDKRTASTLLTVWRVLAVAFGALLLVYGVVMAFSLNINVGLLAVWALGAVFILLGLFLKPLLRVKWPLIVFAIGLLLLAVMIAFLLLYTPHERVTYTEEVVIVLGAGIDQERVTPQLAARLDCALAYAQQNPTALVIVSGGQGPQETISEALAMERYLLEGGLPASRIRREEASTSTYTNLTNTKALLDSMWETPYRAVLITSDYHLYRASRLAEEVGLSCSFLSAPTPRGEAPVRLLRECAAVLARWLFGVRT